MRFRIYHDLRELRDDIQKIPPANRIQIQRAISERLTVDPIRLGKALEGKYKGLRRLRVGDWRIVYKVDGDSVVIRSIKLRRDSYKD